MIPWSVEAIPTFIVISIVVTRPFLFVRDSRPYTRVAGRPLVIRTAPIVRQLCHSEEVHSIFHIADGGLHCGNDQIFETDASRSGFCPVAGSVDPKFYVLHHRGFTIPCGFPRRDEGCTRTFNANVHRRKAVGSSPGWRLFATTSVRVGCQVYHCPERPLPDEILSRFVCGRHNNTHSWQSVCLP